MTRNERKRLAIKRAVIRARQELVRDNLSTPADYFKPRGNLVSHAYQGTLARAWVKGATPIAPTRVLPGKSLDGRDMRNDSRPSGRDKNGKMRINLNAFFDNRMNKKAK